MTSPRKSGPSFLTRSWCQTSLLKTTGKALLLIILSELSQNTRKDFSDLLCLCPGKIRTTRAFSGPLRRNSSGTTIWPSSGLLGLAVFGKKLSLMSPRVGTLVSNKASKLPSSLVWKGSAICPDSYSRPLAQVE